jgi:hypothetical protein
MDHLSGAPPFRGKLVVLPGHFAVCQVPPETPLPPPPLTAALWSITRACGELSIVVPEDHVPDHGRCERGWRCLQVLGPLDFGLTGVLSSLSVPLATAGIPIFALSTYDTDYVLVRGTDIERAVAALEMHGHEVQVGSPPRSQH